MHNHYSRFLSVDWHTRCRVHLKVQFPSIMVRVQHLASKVLRCAKLGVCAKIGTLTLLKRLIKFLLQRFNTALFLWQTLINVCMYIRNIWTYVYWHHISLLSAAQKNYT
jgi:hypothetical protein